MSIFGNVFEDEEKKKEQGGGSDTFTVSKPSGKIFGDVFADAGGSEKQQQVDQSTKGLTASTETPEKRGFFAKAVDAGKNAVKYGLDAWNALQKRNEEASFKMREAMYHSTVKVDPLTGQRALTSDRAERYKNATTDEERQKIIAEQTAEIPLIKMMNSATGKKVISTVSEKTSNIPLKTFATFSAIGDKTYDEAYSAWLAERNDPQNPTWQKFLYEVQDTGVQSSIGALLALGTSYVTKSPTTGYAISSAYYTALSADEQLQERGKVDSLGNIAIDVVGDQLLNTLLLKVIGGQTSGSVLKSTLQGFGVEGSTEVSQSLLKYANDYGNARTEAQKQAVLDNAKRYVVEGGMAMEFFVGGTVGGILTGGAEYFVPNVDSATIDKAREDIMTSEAFDFERAVESGDVQRSQVYQVPEGSVEERIARIQSNPTEVTLYRGQSKDGGGMHFTDDPSWSRSFGEEEVVGKLPKNAKIYTLTEQDLSISADLGATTDAEMYQRFFDMGYDAVIGTDSRNPNEVDIIVDPEIVAGFSKVDGDSVVKLSPKFAEGRINDIAQKLGRVSPELESAFRERVDVNNVHSIAELQGIANKILNRTNVKVNPSSQPNQPTTRPNARQRFVPEVENTDIAKIAEELIQLERTLDPNDETQVDRVLTLRDIMNDYVQSFRDRTVYVPSDTTDAPLIKVETARLPNEKFVVRYEANVEGDGVGAVYDFSRTFNTQDEATKDALAAITAWAQSREAQTPEQKVGYEKILDYAKNPRAPIAPNAPKPKEPRTETVKYDTVKPKEEESVIPEIYREGSRFYTDTSKETREEYVNRLISGIGEQREGNRKLLIGFYNDQKRRQQSEKGAETERIGAKQGQGEAKTEKKGKVSKTQKERVIEAVKEGEKTIQEVAEETGILEPNVRRILGMGAKEGVFTRVDKGVYVLSKDGTDTAWVIPQDAIETLPRLAKDGFKADMIFLDIPYDTPAVKGGNRGVKYNLISVEDFKKVVSAVLDIVRDDQTPIFHMYSQAPSGMKKMEEYNKVLTDAGLKPIARGEYQKTFADGSPVTSPNGKVAKPEVLVLFTKSGKFRKEEVNLSFKLLRPKGYQTEKPAEMMKALIEMGTDEGDLVLDPFAGSGVTGAEAVKAGRKAVLIEKNTEVVENITVPRVKKALEEKKSTNTGKSTYATMTEAQTALEEAGQLEGGIEDIQKFGQASRGINKTLKSDDFLAGGLREGILTDSFLLIKDRNIVEKEVERLASKWRMVFATIKSRVKTAPFPDTSFLFEKKIGEEATVEGYYFDKKTSNTFVSLKSKSERMAVVADKLAYMNKMLPEAEMHFGEHDKSGFKVVQFVRDGEVVGFLMPVVKGGNPFEIEKVKLDYKIPKKADAYIDARTAFGEAGGQPEVGGAQLPEVMGGIKEINPIEMPELVDIARELSGEVPAIKKKISSTGTLGLHQNGKLKILASLFEEGNLAMASKVMAHEIGHLIDFMPDRSPNRNRNIIGRIFTLRDFLKETFNPSDGTSFTQAERSKIRGEVEREFMAKNGIKDKKDLTLEQKKEISTEYKRIVKMVIENDGFIQEEVLKKELIEATRYWNPYDPETVPESYRAYRESTAELYAEALSMLFNAPNRLKSIAPTFYERFFEALDKKPNVRNVYFEIQALLSGDRELIVKRRREGVKTMFKEGDYKAIELHNRKVAEKEERRKQYWTHFKHTVIDKNFQIIDRVKKAQREGKVINPDENPVYFLEERNYLGGKIKAIFERDFNTIYQTLTENEISWDDFGEVMFYMRIAAGDRSDVANPRGITPDAAKELVKDVVKNYTPEQRRVLTESVEKFQQASRKITEEAFGAGLYKPELYAQMQENPAYVTFQVLDHLESGMTSRVYKSIGTLKDIANPADSTMLKIIATIRATERNRVTKSTVDFLRQNFPEDIEEAKYTGSAKGRFPIPSKDPNKELITYFEKGVMKGYYVDPYIAESINNQSVGANAPIVPAIRFMNSTFFRPLFISFNLGFQSFNLIRDFVRTYKNFPNLSFAKTFQLYGKAGRIAKIRAFGKPKNPSAADIEAINLLSKLEEEKVLSITYNDIISGQTELDKQVEKILADTGIKDFQPKPRIENVPRFAKPVARAFEKAGIVDVTSAILGFVENLGNLIETLPKAAGTFYLMEQNNGEFLTQEQQAFIRRKIGSPDFLAGGTYKPITNEVFLFSNAIIQGIRSDIEIATDPQTRSGWWWKTTKVTFIPKMLMMAVLLGAFGDEWKELMESASEYDRTNYNIIPFGKDANGKAIYFRVPVDETSRFLGGMFWKVLTMGRNEQTVAQDLMQVFSYTGGQIPSVSPAIQSLVATTQYLSGQNPYDWFRGRNVISDTVFQAGGTESLKSFLGWQFQQLGGGIFYRFYHEPTAPKAESTAEKVFNLPVLGNILGRFVRVSDYGKLEELRAVEKRVQKEEAQQILKDRELVNKYLKQAQEQNIRFNTKALEDAMIREAFDGLPNTKKEAEKANRLVKKLKLGIKRGDSDATVVSIIDANTNAQKLELLKVIREDMSSEEFATLKRDLLENKIVSTDVFDELEQ